jgi:hypothetical protein
MLILKNRDSFNLHLMKEKQKKAFRSKSLLNGGFMLLQCYRLVDRHFFE